MSFLDQIQSRKSVLKETTTVIRRADGQNYLEDSEMRRLGVPPVKSSEADTLGFVVDTAPDNIPVPIVPGIYIGSQDCVESDTLQRFNITHVLSVGIRVETHGIGYLFVPCLDLPETAIHPVIETAKDYINECLSSGGVVLIHCNAGVSRTSMVVIGYLMLDRNMTFDDAFSLVKSKRLCIRPNDGFMRQLRNLDSAKSNVDEVGSGPSHC